MHEIAGTKIRIRDTVGRRLTGDQARIKLKVDLKDNVRSFETIVKL